MQVARFDWLSRSLISGPRTNVGALQKHMLGYFWIIFHKIIKIQVYPLNSLNFNLLIFGIKLFNCR